ncbi:MAG: AraC family ligand binding domain-containing protein [Pseudomonadota bacterium]
MTDLHERIVRYTALRPCKTAFIDTHTPGSDQKENFTIIGSGVSESKDQHVHITETPGFNIGAAGQPPHCVNSLHAHTTAEVFFVLHGTWRFFWGLHGDAGELVATPGDIFNIPTGIFRGFENIGTDYGMLMAILGGENSGGGVTWAPHVLEAAKAHGLILGEDGQLYDTTKGETLPATVKPMPPLSDKELQAYPEMPVQEVVRNYIARYYDLVALARDKPALVIAPDGLLRDRPGFSVELITRHSLSPTDAVICDQYQVLMPMQGAWNLQCEGQQFIVQAGDTCLIRPDEAYKIFASDDNASLYRVRATNDPAGPTWVPEHG